MDPFASALRICACLETEVCAIFRNMVWCVCAFTRLRLLFFLMIFHPPLQKNKKERKSCSLSFFATKVLKINKKMLGFITNRLLNALNCTYAPYASCKALMSVTPDDDVKWYNFLLSLFISIIVT